MPFSKTILSLSIINKTYCTATLWFDKLVTRRTTAFYLLFVYFSFDDAKVWDVEKRITIYLLNTHPGKLVHPKEDEYKKIHV